MRLEETEHAIQCSFFEWVDLYKGRFPELDLIYAIPNSAKRGVMNGWMMQLSGTRRGVPDVHLPVRDEVANYDGLWIEFKSEKGVVNDAQQSWHDKLRKFNHRVEVCRSWTEAANIVIDYLELPLKKF